MGATGAMGRWRAAAVLAVFGAALVYFAAREGRRPAAEPLAIHPLPGDPVAAVAGEPAPPAEPGPAARRVIGAGDVVVPAQPAGGGGDPGRRPAARVPGQARRPGVGVDAG